MSRTLLQIITTVQAELGLSQASSVIGNTDITTSQMLALLNTAVDDLRLANNWTRLHLEYNLAVNPPTTVLGNLTANSPTITNISPNTTGLLAQFYQVSGNGIPIAARIQSVDSATQVTMTMEATGTATQTSLVMSQDTYPEPSDFGYFENNTWFDRTNRWRLLGPDSPQQDQFVRSGIVALGPRRHFRQLGALSNTYRLWPPPAELVNPIQLVFEYLSLNSIATGGNTSLTTRTNQFTTDSDTCFIDPVADRLLIMSLKWRFWQQKGFAYSQLRKDYDMLLEQAIARDGGAKTLSLVPRVVPFLIDVTNVQDSNYPGPTGPNSS
jgi:hypothetical protein